MSASAVRPGQRYRDPSLVPPARLELALLDPQVARELGIVDPNLLDEALGVLAADERVDGVAVRA